MRDRQERALAVGVAAAAGCRCVDDLARNDAERLAATNARRQFERDQPC